jgi:co-chaperonin GroES (HSP10)
MDNLAEKELESTQEMVAKFKGHALNYNVVIHQIVNENITEGGLDLTNVTDKNEKIKKGIVISVGASCPKDDGEIKPGDTVLFDQYKTSPLTYDAVEYVLVFYGDLIHVL